MSDLAPEHKAERRRRRSLQPLEWMTVVHVGVFLIAATWGFGGQAEWIRVPLTAWGSLGFLITLAALLRKLPSPDANAVRWGWWAVPVLVFNLVVLAASCNPGMQEVRFGTETLLAPLNSRAAWPSSARPLLAREALWEFDVIWISCFNLVLIVRRRRALRALLLLLAANALVLAIFGTVQKLTGAPGLYFGSVPSPQKYFFASFVYHNHWGAFVLLALAVCLGLIAHYVQHHHGRDILHSPAVLGMSVLMILAATVPLSASRSATILATFLLGGAFIKWVAGQVRKRRHFNESIAPTLAAATLTLVVAVGAVSHLAKDTIATRIALTVEQLSHSRTTHGADSRVLLYTDTLRMARDKPWFGWGMASYPHVFTLYNTRESIDRLPVFYHDAHSDWLQALAEHGVIGSALLVASVILPLATLWRRRTVSGLTLLLLVGCALVVAYAVLEFPFGNFAVRLTWWLCFYSAVMYALLRRAGVPEIDERLPGDSAPPCST